VGGARLEGLARVRHVIASVFVRLEEDSQTRKVFEVLLPRWNT
jgi:hypothetical protein